MIFRNNKLYTKELPLVQPELNIIWALNALGTSTHCNANLPLDKRSPYENGKNVRTQKTKPHHLDDLPVDFRLCSEIDALLVHITAPEDCTY